MRPAPRRTSATFARRKGHGLRAVIGSAIGAFAVVAVAAPARAEAPPAEPVPDPVRLDYDRIAGGATCPEESFFRDTVASHLRGRDPFTPDGARRIAIAIRRKGHKFIVSAAMYDDGGKPVGGKRELDGTLCTGVVDTMGVVVAGWLLPIVLPAPAKAEPAKPEPAKPPEPPKPAPAKPEGPKPPAPAKPEDLKPAPPAPTRPRIVVELGPLVSFATLPGPAAFGLAGAVGVRWPMFSLALEVRGDLPAATDPQSDGSRVREALIVGSAAPCLHAGWFVGCALIAGGVRIDEGLNRDVSTPIVPYIGMGVRAGVEVPLSPRFALRLAGEVLAPLRRHRIGDSKEDPWISPPAGVALGARLIAAF